MKCANLAVLALACALFSSGVSAADRTGAKSSVSATRAEACAEATGFAGTAAVAAAGYKGGVDTGACQCSQRERAVRSQRWECSVSWQAWEDAGSGYSAVGAKSSSADSRARACTEATNFASSAGKVGAHYSGSVSTDACYCGEDEDASAQFRWSCAVTWRAKAPR